jgi:N utilization substance protein A
MAMNINELEKVLEQVGKDKGIDRTLLISAIEEAMIMVARKKFGMTREIEARYNDELGEVELFEFKIVVEKVRDTNKEISFEEAKTYDPDVTMGDSLGMKMDTTLLTRIAAQTAKQVIIQKIREAEKVSVVAEFGKRQGEIVSGTVQRMERGNIFIDLGRATGILRGPPPE